MAQRTLAEAVAEIRLSDRKLTGDLATLKARLVQAAQQIEKDVQVNVSFKLDDKKVANDVAKLKQTVSAIQPVVTPVVEPNAEKRVADRLAKIRAEIGLTVDPAPAIATGNRTADRLSKLRASLGLDADPRPAKQAIDEAGDYAQQQLPSDFEQAGQQSGSRFGSALKHGFQAIAATVGVAAGGFIAGALVTGFARLTTIEDATAALTVQLGDATKAADLLGEVLAVVRGTPFNLDQFAKAAANMVAFGVEVQKIPGFLRAIGEAAASQGSRANEVAQRLSLIFGQITTANRIGGEEILQFSEAGVNALAILGNHFGKTTTEIRDMISNGVVPAKQALDILAEGILKGTNGIAGQTVAFEGTMAKLRNTLTGSIGGFKAATARFGVELISPFKEGIIGAFQGATAAIDNLGKRVREAFGGIARSDFGGALTDTLKNIPTIVDDVIEGLEKLGPAVAPLLAIFGAGGLGALGSLPVVGQFLPMVTMFGTMAAALGALVAFTPELRNQFLPILQQILELVVEFGAVAGVAAGKITEALVPVGAKLIQAFGQLVPVAKAAVAFGEGLLGVVVPAVQLLAAAFDKIPTPVITALVTAFLGFRLVTHEFDLLNKATRNLSLGFQIFDRSSTTAAERMEKGATRAQAAMGKMYLAVGGAFSGMALASKQGSQQIVGAIGAIGSVAAGAATGGVWGAAAAGIGVAAGLIVGHFTEAAREAAALRAQIDGVADSFSNATLEILKSRDALIAFNEQGVANLTTSLGESLLANTATVEDKSAGAAKTFGELTTNMLLAFDLPASGKAGGQAIVDLLGEMADRGGKLSEVPTVIGAINTEFGDQANLILPLLDRYDSVAKLLEAIKNRQRDIENGTLPDTTGMSAADKQREDQLTAAARAFAGGVSDAQEEQIRKALDLAKIYDNIGNDDALKGVVEAQLLANEGADEGFRIAFKRASEELKLDREKADARELLEAQALAMNKLEHDRLGILNDQIASDVLAGKVAGQNLITDEARGRTTDERQRAAERHNALLGVAQDLGVSILDIDKQTADAVGGNLQQYRDIEKQISEGVVPAIDDSEQALSASEQAAKNLAAAVLLSKTAAEAVSAEIGKLHQALEDTSAATSLLEAINAIKSASTNIVNEKDLAEREKAEKDMASTRDKILELQRDVELENQKAAARLEDLQAQRVKAVALGSTRGVEAIDRDIAQVFDKAREKEGELAEAEAKAAELGARIAELPQKALTEMQQLRDQAQFTGLSLLDLIVSGATPEAAGFQGKLMSFFTEQINQFKAAAEADPSNAFKIADTFTESVRTALLAGGADPATAEALVDKYFNLVPATQEIRKAAGAAELAYRAELRKALVDDPELGKLADKVNLLPTSEQAAVEAALRRDDLQREFDKQNIEAGIAIRPLTDEDIALLQQMEIDAVTQLNSVDMNAAITAINTPVVNITAGTVNPLIPVSDADRAQAKLARDTARGVFNREGGVLDPAHVAQIVSAGMYRVFAEPETHGEGYIPLSPHKRTRSLGVMAEIADIFGYQLEPKDRTPATPLPGVFAGTAVGTVDADAIGRAVAHHTARTTASRLADQYDHAVHVESGAIVIQEARTPRRTAIRLVSQLAELALKRR